MVFQEYSSTPRPDILEDLAIALRDSPHANGGSFERLVLVNCDPITEDIVDQLKAILGADCVMRGDSTWWS